MHRQTVTDIIHGEGNQINHNNLIRITVSNNRNIYLKISHINVHSICNKTQPFQEYILSKDVSVCAISESWLPSDDEDLRYKEVPPWVTTSSWNHILMEDVEGVWHWCTKIILN